jgi:hypothetical protein
MEVLYKPFKYNGNGKKKYSVYVKTKGRIKLIHFGDIRYRHYFDKIGVYSNMNHEDRIRRASYRARHTAIMLKDGTFAYKNRAQPSYYSMKYLW